MMKKGILLLVILAIVSGSIFAGVYLVKKRQDLRLRAAPTTTLSLSPASTNKNVNQVFTVNIVVETGSNLIAAADIDLSYNASVLTVEGITPGTFFDSPTELRKQLGTPGKIYYSIGSLTPRQGSGTLASISFRGLAMGVSPVTFDDTSQVGDINEGNVLNNTIDGSYSIVQAGPTVTPTPTPITGGVGGNGGVTPTATPRPTATPIVGTTLVPTPTVSPEDLPVTAYPTPTFLILIIGILLIIGGSLKAFL